MPGPGPGQVADRVEGEPRLTGAPQPQQQQHNSSSSRHNSNNNNKDFYCPNKRQTKDSLAALPLPRLGSILVSQFSLFYLPINEAIFLQVYPTHTHTHPHTPGSTCICKSSCSSALSPSLLPLPQSLLPNLFIRLVYTNLKQNK